MIKIAHITTVDISVRYLLLNTLISLNENGYEVYSVSNFRNNKSEIEKAGIQCISVPINRKTFSPISDMITLWKLFLIFRKEKFTIVHTHFHKSGIYGRLAARMAQVPVVIHTSHGLIFQNDTPKIFRTLFVKLERYVGRYTDLIFSVNLEDINTMLKEKIIAPEKCQYLGSGGIGIDLTKFDPIKIEKKDVLIKKREMGISEDIYIIGFVGRLVEEKGLLELMQAAKLVKDKIPKVKFIIIGPTEPEKKDGLNYNIAEKYGVNDICIFTGIRQDMPELYAIMDVFVLPSHREGLPRSPMEALAMGVPCILTDIRGCREVVDDNINGLLVPLGNIEAIATAIIDLLTNKDKAIKMGKEGRKKALEKFDEQKVFDKIKFEYKKMIEEKKCN
jgi:glycosyltransferase involved in cell wall biosynthesis